MTKELASGSPESLASPTSQNGVYLFQNRAWPQLQGTEMLRRFDLSSDLMSASMEKADSWRKGQVENNDAVQRWDRAEQPALPGELMARLSEWTF